MSAGRKHISVKKDWNTPPKYIEPIIKMFGEIDLDPCSNETSLVNAKIKYTINDDGLTQNWNYKNIFVNPPYGRNTDNKTTIYQWIEKGAKASDTGSEVLFLIPVATNTKHFKELIFKKAIGICFLNDTRLKFWNNGIEDKKGAPMACCIVYFGLFFDKFQSIFYKYGKCVKL